MGKAAWVRKGGERWEEARGLQIQVGALQASASLSGGGELAVGSVIPLCPGL